MSGKASESPKKFRAPLQQTYWSLLAVCFASFLIGIAPDNSDQYSTARKELEAIKRLPNRNVNSTEDYLLWRLEKTPANVTPIIDGELKNAGFHPEKVTARLVYFEMEKGVQIVPDQISAIVDDFATNPDFVVLTPQPDQLRDGLHQALANAKPSEGDIADVSIACNYGGQRCQISLMFRAQFGAANAFFVDAVHSTAGNLANEIARYSPYFNKAGMQLPGINAILADIYEQSLDKAYSITLTKIGVHEGDVSVFGVSVKGDTALTVVPVTVVFALLFLLATLLEIDANDGAEDLRDCPLFFRNELGYWIGWGSTLLVPIAVVIQPVQRFFKASAWTSWLGVALGIAAIGLALLLELERRRLIHVRRRG